MPSRPFHFALVNLSSLGRARRCAGGEDTTSMHYLKGGFPYLLTATKRRCRHIHKRIYVKNIAGQNCSTRYAERRSPSSSRFSKLFVGSYLLRQSPKTSPRGLTIYGSGTHCECLHLAFIHQMYVIRCENIFFQARRRMASLSEKLRVTVPPKPRIFAGGHEANLPLQRS